MNYLQYGCMLFIIPRYPKMDVIEILRDGGNHLENNSFMKIHKTVN